VWRWRARAEHGPIEHSVSIQNLGDEPVWLPLQPSFEFDWQVDRQVALERFWVEKGADVPSAEGTHLDALVRRRYLAGLIQQLTPVPSRPARER
jgi:hypothetical protein